MNQKLLILLFLCSICLSVINAQDSTEAITITIEDLIQRAEDAKEGIYYSFKSNDEEKEFSKHMYSQIYELESKLAKKTAELDTLRILINKFIVEKEKKEKKLKEGWRNLKMYISMEQVNKLLGSPDAITKHTASTKYWYDNGFIEFNAFKKVCEWAEPRENRTEVIEY